MGKDGPGPENKESFITQQTVKILKLNTTAVISKTQVYLFQF